MGLEPTPETALRLSNRMVKCCNAISALLTNSATGPLIEIGASYSSVQRLTCKENSEKITNLSNYEKNPSFY